MTLEQLQKKRDGCEQAIRKANAERDEIDKQIVFQHKEDPHKVQIINS